jgi:hypothetical protein
MFAFLCWLACGLNSLLLFRAVMRQRSVLVRPSIVFLIFFNLRVQWGAALEAGYAATALDRPYEFFLVIYGVPTAALLLALSYRLRAADTVYERINRIPDSLSYSQRATWFLLLGAVTITLAYLAAVGYRNTGLYVIFTNPLASASARDNSFKLLGNVAVRYSYALVVNAAAPLVGAYAGLAWIHSWRQHATWRMVGNGAVIALAMIMAGLSGARGPSALIILVVLFAWWLRRRAPLSPVYLALSLAAVLLIPTLLTILREGRTVNWSLFWIYYQDSLTRVFGATSRVAIWYAQYVQTAGYFGVAAVAKLASALGKTPVNVANVIGLAYGHGDLRTITANSNFLITYYAEFGLLAMAPCVGLILSLDLCLKAYVALRPELLTGCVAASLIVITNLAESDFTSGLASGGVVPILLLALAIGFVMGGRRPRRAGTAGGAKAGLP